VFLYEVLRLHCAGNTFVLGFPYQRFIERAGRSMRTTFGCDVGKVMKHNEDNVWV
jgi:hypothetical protein